MKPLGFLCLVIASLGWLVALIIPLTHLNLSHKAITFTIALSIAELSFLIAIGLLGKTYYQRLKAKLRALLHKSSNP